MKKSILTLFLLLLSAHVSAHGYPTIDEFYMFPKSFFAQSVANFSGVVVAIPCVVVGSVVGLVSVPIAGGDVKEGLTAGAMFGGMCGYMLGQQLAWPIYGLERGIGWWFK